MRKGRKVRRARRGSKRQVFVKVSSEVAKALKQMQEAGRTVQVVGRVRRGKIEMDAAQLAAVVKLPDPKIAFVALNAPFKTRALTGAR